MFPLARAALSDEQLEEIGELMANRRLAFDRPAGARERNDVAPAP
jgi:hypothetical protein